MTITITGISHQSGAIFTAQFTVSGSSITHSDLAVEFQSDASKSFADVQADAFSAATSALQS
ncbi:MAG: hypothetical protein JKP96_09930 [Oceanicaulis sp.]|jgi:hypothetical protein|nr:hypothetical protein [Oceanicaulis sp.]